MAEQPCDRLGGIVFDQHVWGVGRSKGRFPLACSDWNRTANRPRLLRGVPTDGVLGREGGGGE